MRAEFPAIEGARERLTLTWHLSYADTPPVEDSRLGARPHGGVVARVERALPASACGGLLIAEDGDGKQHLIGSTDRGETFFFARNDDRESAEFVGPTSHPTARSSSPTCRNPVESYAIRGPFKKQRR